MDGLENFPSYEIEPGRYTTAIESTNVGAYDSEIRDYHKECEIIDGTINCQEVEGSADVLSKRIVQTTYPSNHTTIINYQYPDAADQVVEKTRPGAIEQLEKQIAMDRRMSGWDQFANNIEHTARLNLLNYMDSKSKIAHSPIHLRSLKLKWHLLKDWRELE